MEIFVKMFFSFFLLLTVAEGIIVATEEIPPPGYTLKEEIAQPVIYVTPSNPTEIENGQGDKQKTRKYQVEEVEEELLSTAATGNDAQPFRYTFPSLRNDQQRQPTNYNSRRPSKEAPRPILSSARDSTLTNPQNLQDVPVAATYESIVYNPDSKDASSAFSQSNYWETPDLVVRDTKQRQEGKNSVITTSNRIEFTPNLKSVQTPLNQIQYQRQPFSSPARPQAIRKPTQQTIVENDEEGEEESRNQEIEENSEEQNEEEEEERRPAYPVNLGNNETPFGPYENVQEPDDIYNDVLSKIGSVFNDDHSSPLQRHSSQEREKSPGSDHGLLPQFDHYSYENLQQQERDDVREDGGDYIEDNEELVEYDDEAEEETKQVPLQKPKNFSAAPQNIVQNTNQLSKNQQNHKKSPFPNVKILENPNQVPKQSGKVSFSPWLPTQSPTFNQQGLVSFSPWLPTQPPTPTHPPRQWQHTSPKSYPQQSWQQTVPKHNVQKQPFNWEKNSKNTHGPKTNVKKKSPEKEPEKLSKWWSEPNNSENNEQKQSQNLETKKPYDWEKPKKKVSSKGKAGNKEEAAKQVQKTQQTSHTRSHPKSSDNDHKPYEESYKSSYNKSWKSSSPETNDHSSYSSSYGESSTAKPKNKKYKTEQNYSTSNQEQRKSRPEKRPKKSPTRKANRRSDSFPENSYREESKIFVTPLPKQEVSKDSVASSSGRIENSPMGEFTEESTVLKIDELYNIQHNKI